MKFPARYRDVSSWHPEGFDRADERLQCPLAGKTERHEDMPGERPGSVRMFHGNPGLFLPENPIARLFQSPCQEFFCEWIFFFFCMNQWRKNCGWILIFGLHMQWLYGLIFVKWNVDEWYWSSCENAMFIYEIARIMWEWVLQMLWLSFPVNTWIFMFKMVKWIMCCGLLMIYLEFLGFLLDMGMKLGSYLACK